MSMVRLEPIKRETLNVSEIATYLGVSTDKIYIMAREKSIPCFRIGSRVLFKKEAIDKWIESKINESYENEQ